jgi:Cytochrome c7 and related cytochrome c
MTVPTTMMTMDPPPPPNPTKPPVASTELQKLLGAKIAVEGTLEATVKKIELEPDRMKRQAAIKTLMESFNAALGVKCNYCHTAVKAGKPDYQAPSDNKNIAAAMWKEYVTALKYRDGQPLYCDSCHQGQAKFLTVDMQLSNWMSNNFVAKFERTDGTEQGCASCHGMPFQTDIIERMKKP